MTDYELGQLLEQSRAESEAIEAKYHRGETLTRQDCNRLRIATQRIGIVARELWLMAGKPEGFPELEQPIKRSPLPKSMRAIDLTTNHSTEVH